MGDKQDAGGEQNLEVIRELLQKLEDAARKDAEGRQAPPPVSGTAPVSMPETSVLRPIEMPASTRELASLHRGTPSLNVVPTEPAPSPIMRQVDFQGGPETRRPRPFVVLPLIAFVLGVASAIAAVWSIEDLRRLVMKMPDATVGAGSRVPAAKGPSLETAKAPEPAAPQASSLEPGRSGATTEPAGANKDGSGVASPNRSVGSDGNGSAASRIVGDAASVAASSIARTPPLDVKLTLPPRFTIASGERMAFPIRIEPPAKETDGLLLVLRGLPDNLQLSKGNSIGSGIWMLPAHSADALEISIDEATLKAIHVDTELVGLDGRILARGETNIEVVASVAVGGATERLKLDERAMFRLGEMLLDTGDLAGARAVFEKAALAGSAQAALRLAETYDPDQLPGSGLQPAAADHEAARRWYEKAKELGSTVATERLAVKPK